MEWSTYNRNFEQCAESFESGLSWWEGHEPFDNGDGFDHDVDRSLNSLSFSLFGGTKGRDKRAHDSEVMGEGKRKAPSVM